MHIITVGTGQGDSHKTKNVASMEATLVGIR